MHGGRGSPVVFIHGLGSSSYMEWRYTLEPTAERHRVYAPDLPGYGRTEKPRARYTIPYFARFVERYIEDRGLRSAVLVGASLGGRIALELALEQPRLVRKLVLVNTLGLGRPQIRMAQMAYGLVTIPRVGEAVMRFTRDALGWASPKMIRRVAGRYAGASSDLERSMDDVYLGNLREMYAGDDFHNAYLSTVRSLINPRALFGGNHDVTARLRWSRTRAWPSSRGRVTHRRPSGQRSSTASSSSSSTASPPPPPKQYTGPEYRALVAAPLDPLVHPDPTHPPRLYRLIRRIVRWLVLHLFRITVNGLENIPAPPYIIAANHQAWFDPAFIIPFFPAAPMIYTMAKRETVFNQIGRAH